MKKRLLLLLLSTLFLFGCAGTPAAEPSAPPSSAAPTATATPIPVTPNPAEIQGAAQNAFRAALDLSFLTPYFSEERRAYGDFIAQEEEFSSLSLAISSAVSAALVDALTVICEKYPDAEVNLNSAVGALDARMVMAFASCLPAKDGATHLAKTLPVSFAVESSAGEITLSASTSFASPRRLLSWIAGDDPKLYTSLRMSYAYFTTVYDEEGNLSDQSRPLLSEWDNWVFPLPASAVTRFRDTWFADRDGGARRHTGTDISAPEGTEIYAAAGGRIVDVGYNEGMGNYVILFDEMTGLEYYYMHMVEQTPFLEPGDTVGAGDIIGHVGNTGNSDVNHLHLSVIESSGRFLAPYAYLKSALDREA